MSEIGLYRTTFECTKLVLDQHCVLVYFDKNKRFNQTSQLVVPLEQLRAKTLFKVLGKRVL